MLLLQDQVRDVEVKEPSMQAAVGAVLIGHGCKHCRLRGIESCQPKPRPYGVRVESPAEHLDQRLGPFSAHGLALAHQVGQLKSRDRGDMTKCQIPYNANYHRTRFMRLGLLKANFAEPGLETGVGA